MEHTLAVVATVNRSDRYPYGRPARAHRAAVGGSSEITWTPHSQHARSSIMLEGGLRFPTWPYVSHRVPLKLRSRHGGRGVD